jgi:hypothetical protein
LSSTVLDLSAFLDSAVFMGNSIPSHDETHDLAGEIAQKAAAFHDYVASVRSPEQADAALVELAEAFLAAAKAVKTEVST